MKTTGSQNFRGRQHVVLCVREINDVHVAGPGLGVVKVAARDDQSVFAVQELLAGRWATAAADRTTRVPGEPGVRLRFFLDVRQEAGA